MQFKRRRIHKRIANVPADDAHLDSRMPRVLSGQERMDFHDHIHVRPLAVVVRALPGHDDQVQVAFCRIVAAHCRRAVKIDPDQVLPEDLRGSFRKPFSHFIHSILPPLFCSSAAASICASGACITFQHRAAPSKPRSRIAASDSLIYPAFVRTSSSL